MATALKKHKSKLKGILNSMFKEPLDDKYIKVSKRGDVSLKMGVPVNRHSLTSLNLKQEWFPHISELYKFVKCFNKLSGVKENSLEIKDLVLKHSAKSKKFVKYRYNDIFVPPTQPEKNIEAAVENAKSDIKNKKPMIFLARLNGRVTREGRSSFLCHSLKGGYKGKSVKVFYYLRPSGTDKAKAKIEKQLENFSETKDPMIFEAVPALEKSKPIKGAGGEIHLYFSIVSKRQMAPVKVKHWNHYMAPKEAEGAAQQKFTFEDI